jgi:hypothetical protein
VAAVVVAVAAAVVSAAAAVSVAVDSVAVGFAGAAGVAAEAGVAAMVTAATVTADMDATSATAGAVSSARIIDRGYRRRSNARSAKNMRCVGQPTHLFFCFCNVTRPHLRSALRDGADRGCLRIHERHLLAARRVAVAFFVAAMKAVLLDLPAVMPAPPEKMKSSIYFNGLFGRKSWIYGRYVQVRLPGRPRTDVRRLTKCPAHKETP